MSSPKLSPALELPLPAGLASVGPACSDAVQRDVLRLFDECGEGVRRYVRSFGLSAEAADDVVQEVFLALFRHLLGGRPRGNLRGWIFQVGHHLALKQREKLAVRQAREADLEGPLAARLIDQAADPEQQLVEGQRRRQLWSVVRALPERDRRCLYLRAEGLRYREIAGALKVSLATVAKSLARATARLVDSDQDRSTPSAPTTALPTAPDRPGRQQARRALP